MDGLKSKRNIKQFDGEKYSVWKFRIRALLSELDAIKVIDEDPIIRCSSWEQNNRIAKSVIIEYLSDSYLSYAKEDSSARDIFKRLDDLYERKSIATQLALRKKLLALKLQGDVMLMKHFAVFDELITELLAAGAKLEETDKIAHLLLTLPSVYNGVITAIETLSEDNLSLAFVKTRLLDHEVKLKNESGDTSSKVLHVDKRFDNRKRRFENDNRKRKFEYSQPANSFNQKDKMKKRSHIIKCHHCGRKGHVKNECYFYKNMNQQKPYKNENTTRTIQAIETSQPSSSNEFSGFAFMTGEYQADDRGNKIAFLLDSGASDHIINREDRFIDHIDEDEGVCIATLENFDC